MEINFTKPKHISRPGGSGRGTTGPGAVRLYRQTAFSIVTPIAAGPGPRTGHAGAVPFPGYLGPVFFLVALLLAFSPATAQPAKNATDNRKILEKLTFVPGKHPVVIDTDTYNEIDDQFALVYALLSPEAMNVEAVYAAPFHNNRSSGPGDGMQKSYEEILRVFEKMKTPANQMVFKGSDRFLADHHTPVRSDAADDLVKRALASRETLYVLTLGAPTNVASALLMEPRIKDKIVVVWLGGKGLHWNTAYEFNLKQDYHASRILFDSGVPLVQIPTEPVSSHLLTTLAELRGHLAGKNEIADYLVRIYEDYHKDHYGWAKVIWDISVVAWLVNPKWIPTEVRATPVLTREFTYSLDNSRHLYKVATFADRNRIFTDMFRKISAFKPSN